MAISKSTNRARIILTCGQDGRRRLDGVYRDILAPILERHGVVLNGDPPDGGDLFVQTVEVGCAEDISGIATALAGDPEWGEAMRAAGNGQPLEWHFGALTCRAGEGRTVEAGEGSANWRSLDMTDGLGGGTVSAVVEDRYGSLWIGTSEGLSRYDGETIFRYDLGHQGRRNVYAIAIDRQERTWVGTHEGVFCGSIPQIHEDRKGDASLFSALADDFDLPDLSCGAVAEDRDGLIWIGTAQGLYIYDGDTVQAVSEDRETPVPPIRAICPRSEGGVWVGSPGGLHLVEGESIRRWGKESGLPHAHVCAIVECPDGSLYLGTGSVNEGGCVRCRLEGDILLVDQEGGGNPESTQVLSVAVDAAELLWTGSLDGATRFDGGKPRTFTTDDGLTHNWVYSIHEDRDRRFWFGTANGLCRYDPAWTTFTDRDGLGSRSVWSVCQARDGRMWFGTEGGVTCYDEENGTFTTFTRRDGLASDWVWPICEDRDGNLWFGHRGGGVTRYDGETFRVFSKADGLLHDDVASIFEDSRGTIWVGTYLTGGVCRLEGDRFVPFPQDRWVGGSGVRAIHEDADGILSFGTGHQGGGLVRYDPEADTIRRFSSEDGLSGNAIWSVDSDSRGRLWIGDGAPTCYDGRRYHSIHPSAYTRCILEDRNGHLWFTTFAGVWRHHDGVSQQITSADGLASNDVRTIFEDRSGNLWFATVKGLTRYTPRTESTSPRVRIESVVADRRYAANGKTTVTAARTISIAFRGTSLKTRPGALVYRYRLSGEGRGWDTTRDRSVDFRDLRPGSYTFEVQAIDRDVCRSEIAKLALTVVPDPRIQALSEVLSGGHGDFVGESATLTDTQRELAKVAPTDLTVLILGETGTGKGLAASALHRASERADGPFIQVNCAAIPEGLVESELFGHEKGAFTGASQLRLGRVELAEGGSLFLDEIGDLSDDSQAKLLRLLQESTYERVGATETRRADVRVIAATNRDLPKMVAEGTFREDLYFRLNTFPISMPSLRDRLDDIPQLAAYFATLMAEHIGKPTVRLSDGTVDKLRSYHWPGNVRELEHTIQRSVIVCDGDTIQPGDIVLEFEARSPEGDSMTSLEEHERRYVIRVLESTGWKVEGPGGAAEILEINPSTLRSRIKRLGIQSRRQP